MAQDEKRALWYIKKIPLFQDVSHDTIHRLVQCIELKEVRRRQVIYLPGDPGQAVFFVNGGRVKISKVTRDGKELTLAYRGPGEIFGELVMIDGGPREEMAEAMENALISEIERAEFEKIVQKEGVIGFRLTKIVSQRRRDVENKIEQLIFKDRGAQGDPRRSRRATRVGLDPIGEARRGRDVRHEPFSAAGRAVRLNGGRLSTNGLERQRRKASRHGLFLGPVDPCLLLRHRVHPQGGDIPGAGFVHNSARYCPGVVAVQRLNA